MVIREPVLVRSMFVCIYLSSTDLLSPPKLPTHVHNLICISNSCALRDICIFCSAFMPMFAKAKNWDTPGPGDACRSIGTIGISSIFLCTLEMSVRVHKLS